MLTFIVMQTLTGYLKFLKSQDNYFDLNPDNSLFN